MESPARSVGNNFQLDDNNSIVSHQSAVNSQKTNRSITVAASPKRTPRKTPSKLKSSIRKTPRKLITKLFGGCRVPEEPKIDIVSSTSVEDPGIDSHESSSSCEEAALESSASLSNIIEGVDSDKMNVSYSNENNFNTGNALSSPSTPTEKPPRPSSVIHGLKTSPDPLEDIFLPESGSSESGDYPLTSPHNPEKLSETSPAGHGLDVQKIPMNTKGPSIGIPTPAPSTATRRQEDDNDDQSFPKVLFPQPLPALRERSLATPLGKKEQGKQDEPSNALEDDEDDDAFLPDDFKTFTFDQVQKKVEEAQEQLRLQHDRALKNFRRELSHEFQQELQIHGKQWKEESEAEYERMDALVKEERNRADRNHLELLNKTNILAEIQAKFEASEKVRVELEATLHRRGETKDTLPSNAEEVETLKKELVKLQGQLQTEQDQAEIQLLRAEKDEANKQILVLKEQIQQLQNCRQSIELTEELVDLRAGKAAQERRINELEEHVKIISSTDPEHTDRSLSQALEQIESLKQELEHKTILGYKNETKLNDEMNQIKDLEKKHQDELRAVRMESTEKLEIQIRAGQDRFDKLWAEFEDEKSEMTQAFNQETEKLKLEIKQLKNQHEAELEKAKTEIRAEASSTIEALQKELKELQVKFKNESSRIIEMNAKSYDELQAKVLDLESEKERSKVVEHELEELRTELDMTRSKYEEEKRGKSELRIELNEANEKFREQLKLATHDAHMAASLEIKNLKEILSQMKEDSKLHSDKLVKAAEERQKMEVYIDGLQQKVEKDVSEARVEASKLEEKLAGMEVERKSLFGQIEKLNEQLKSSEKTHKEELQHVKDQIKLEMNAEAITLKNQLETSRADASDLKQKVQHLEGATELSRQEYERKIAAIRSDNDKQIDEMLAQLDMVEAEVGEQNEKRERMLMEKDAVISALGGQLAEARERLSEATEKQESLTNELVEAQEKAQESIKEVIQKAETQFKNANSTYMKLKREYDASQTRIGSLEKDLRAAKKDMEAVRKKQETREADLEHQLAQTKASIASIEASSARSIKQYRHDIEKYKEVERDLKQKLEDAVATSQSIQSTLATVLKEKERLVVEHREVKAVCEELMELVEGK